MSDASTLLSQSTLPANTPAISSAATALEANPRRTLWYIQNLGTNPLFILYGANASTTVFHKVLKGSTIQDDGTGGEAGQSDDIIYCGVISVAGTTPRYTVLEMNN
jgi:hypothetical protein